MWLLRYLDDDKMRQEYLFYSHVTMLEYCDRRVIASYSCRFVEVWGVEGENDKT
jgi:hypothetical protein